MFSTYFFDLSAVLSYSSVISWYLPPSNSVCAARMWLTALGPTFLLTGIVNRIWQFYRVYSILIKAEKLTNTPISKGRENFSKWKREKLTHIFFSCSRNSHSDTVDYTNSMDKLWSFHPKWPTYWWVWTNLWSRMYMRTLAYLDCNRRYLFHCFIGMGSLCSLHNLVILKLCLII